MSRIITVGCSYTYGHGLSDCIDSNSNAQGPCPSKLGYAQIVADHLERSLINLAQCGIGDKQIMNIVDNTLFDPDDICLIQWSHNDRYCILNKQETVAIGPWMDNKITKTYYKSIHNENDATVMRDVYINYINLKLQSLGIVTYNILPIDAYLCDLNINQSVKMSDKNLQYFRVDCALDKQHPGKKSNKRFAEYLIKEYF